MHISIFRTPRRETNDDPGGSPSICFSIVFTPEKYPSSAWCTAHETWKVSYKFIRLIAGGRPTLSLQGGSFDFRPAKFSSRFLSDRESQSPHPHRKTRQERGSLEGWNGGMGGPAPPGPIPEVVNSAQTSASHEIRKVVALKVAQRNRNPRLTRAKEEYEN